MRGTIDGNEAAVDVAYRLNELCAIYPITPSSTMAELADEWASARRTNVWGSVPTVIEMQSEGGAAGAMHGALQGGAQHRRLSARRGVRAPPEASAGAVRGAQPLVLRRPRSAATG